MILMFHINLTKISVDISQFIITKMRFLMSKGNNKDINHILIRIEIILNINDFNNEILYFIREISF